MLYKLKLHRALGLFVVMFVVQACTCNGRTYEWYQCYYLGGGCDAYLDQLDGVRNSSPQPTATSQPVTASSPAALNCDALRLTSPLDGLPNGTATFYWDALPGATGYQINLFSDGGVFLAGFDAVGDQTNLSADVSMGAVGGQYVLGVEFVALGAQNQACRQAYTLMREAPSQPAPPAPRPTPIPEDEPEVDEEEYELEYGV